MKINVGMAKVNKYAMQHCGDSFDIIERPYGGLSAIIADGQGSGLAAHHTSSWVVNKAASLIADGARDGAVARAVHDYLYAMKDKKVSCTLTLLSADLESETIVISRNSNCPTIVKTDEYLTIYDDDVAPIGVNRHMKPLVYELPFAPGMIVVSFTDGIVEDNPPEDCDFIARSILEYALSLDKEKAGDDMTVVVMGISETSFDGPKVEQLSASYPF